MSPEVQHRVRRAIGADIARRAGVTRTVRLPDGTEYTGLREDIYQSALRAASDVLRKLQADRREAAPAAAADDDGAGGQ